MPNKPYFHGDEDFFAQDGVLLAVRAPFHNMHGLACVGSIKVLTLDKRYQLGDLTARHDGSTAHAVCWRTARGDRVEPSTVDALIARCHDVFGGRPRYRLGERTFDDHKERFQLAPNPRRLDAQMDELYAQLPPLACKGLCHDSCGPIEMSVRERQRIEQRAGRKVTCGTGASCSMLTSDRRCSVYDIRPMICRIWGMVRKMRCPYGCVPEGGFMDDADAMLLLGKAMKLGGFEGATTQQKRMAEEMLRALEADPDTREYARRIARAFFQPATIDGRAKTLDRSGVKSPLDR